MSRTARTKRTPARAAAVGDVDALLDGLRHPLRAEIDRVRAIVVGVSRDVVEEVKWNAPSYRKGDVHFVTFHLRSKDSVQLVLHTGAKKRARPLAMQIADPAGLLAWRGADRCIATIRDVAREERALREVLRAWAAQL